MFQVGSSSHGFTRSSPSSYSASHLNNRASATNSRPCIPHLRVDDEEVVLRKFDVGKKIGQGSFGVVYEVKNKETQEKFALKIINKEKAGLRSNVNFENEVVIMKTVEHPNLIKLMEVFETKKKLYLITELCEAGELAKLIKHHGPIGEKQARIIMKQILDAIYYLHKNDIVHRDLKLENILMKEFDLKSDYFFIKITDFGLSTQRETVGTDSMFEDYCGTPLYMAPEIIENYPYSQLCDIWALGIIMYILLTSHSPFTAESESKLREQIRKAEINTSSKSYNQLSAEAKNCLSRMIRVNPVHRMTSSELVNHPWFLNKRLDEIAEQKNALELMTDMLREQESEKNMVRRIKSSSAFLLTGNEESNVEDNENNSGERTASSCEAAHRVSSSNQLNKNSRNNSAHDRRPDSHPKQKNLLSPTWKNHSLTASSFKSVSSSSSSRSLNKLDKKKSDMSLRRN